LQNLPSDESGDDDNDNEEENVEDVVNQSSSLHEDSSSSSSNNSSSDSEEDNILPLRTRIGKARCSYSFSKSTRPMTNDERLEKQSGKDGTSWQRVHLGRGVAGRSAKQNILRRRPGPTAFATNRVFQNDEASAFRLFFNEPMLRHICKCTSDEGQRVKGVWSVEPAEMDKFIGLVIARGVSGGRTLPLKSMWSAEWGNKLFSLAMSRER